MIYFYYICPYISKILNDSTHLSSPPFLPTILLCSSHLLGAYFFTLLYSPSLPLHIRNFLANPQIFSVEDTSFWSSKSRVLTTSRLFLRKLARYFVNFIQVQFNTLHTLFSALRISSIRIKALKGLQKRWWNFVRNLWLNSILTNIACVLWIKILWTSVLPS